MHEKTMKRHSWIFVTLIVLAFLSGCSRKDPLYPEGCNQYFYFGYDTSGNAVVSGTIRIAKDLTYGDWELKALDDQQDIGPQTGSGSLVCSLKDDTLLCVYLNPNMVDCNVNLTGKLSEKEYTGTWGYYGFAGLMNSGKFIAIENMLP